MSVGLVPQPSDEQAMLLEASCRFIDDTVPLAEVRRRCDEPSPDVALDAAYRASAAELGWLGLLADESVGGGSTSGNGVLDAALIAAERGARLQPGPFTGHSVVVDTLTTVSAAPATLAQLVGGGAWATRAFAAGARLELRDRARLSGTIDVVDEAALCAWILVAADDVTGTAQVLVPLSGPGVRVEPLQGLDVTRSWASIGFDDVEVEVVEPPGERGARLAARQVQLAAVLSAADVVGAMHADLAAAVAYSKQRIAFGRPIGSFQAVKHLLADTSLWLEMSKGLVVDAATALGRGSPDAAELAHAAKAFVAERGVELAHNCFQVFGGIGYTWEHDQHLFLRRITAEAAMFGSASWHRERLLEHAGVGR
jgi:alkylation response protein AidB-like acyl-CoA dehydrogenase